MTSRSLASGVYFSIFVAFSDIFGADSYYIQINGTKMHYNSPLTRFFQKALQLPFNSSRSALISRPEILSRAIKCLPILPAGEPNKVFWRTDLLGEEV